MSTITSAKKTLYTTECNTEDTDTPTEGVQLERGAHLPTQDHSDTQYPQHRKGAHTPHLLGQRLHTSTMCTKLISLV
jgi:hypothetical protein